MNRILVIGGTGNVGRQVVCQLAATGARFRVMTRKPDAADLPPLGSVPEMVIRGIFPWCFTPELYAARPDYIQSLADFVRSRPAQPLNAFLQQSNAVMVHDVESQLDRITAPTLLSFGRHDALTSTRFAAPMMARIRNSELLIFEGCAHAPLYEDVQAFNEKTLQFLHRQAGVRTA